MTQIINTALAITGVAAGAVIAISYSWAQFRKGKSEADSSTIQTYQSEVQALKIKVDRFETDNKALTAQVNQLIGENTTLRQTLTYQDPAFKETIKRILNEIKKMREEFEKHSKMDDTRFTEIVKKLDKTRG